MDDNEDFEYVTAFTPGTGVLMETDDGFELGVVVRIGDAGVLMQSTHRMETVGMASDAEVDKMRSALEDTSTKLLRVFAREAGVGLITSLRLNRDELLQICLDDAINEYNDRAAVNAMVKLVRPIETWVPMDRVKKMMNSKDFAEESSLRDLDFIVEDEENEEKEEEKTDETDK